MSFDIDSLLRFDAAQYQCEKCAGLLKEPSFIEMEKLDKGEMSPICPICHVKYIPTEHGQANQWYAFLGRYYHSIKIGNIFSHLRLLR